MRFLAGRAVRQRGCAVLADCLKSTQLGCRTWKKQQPREVYIFLFLLYLNKNLIQIKIYGDRKFSVFDRLKESAYHVLGCVPVKVIAKG